MANISCALVSCKYDADKVYRVPYITFVQSCSLKDCEYYADKVCSKSSVKIVQRDDTVYCVDYEKNEVNDNGK